MATDLERREQLRSLLTYARSRLSPRDVGLPITGRRRVPGLRRQEVAELIGVSADWYRWFESGRPIEVSPRFLARLSDALRLNAFDQSTLYRLALPGLYWALNKATGESVTSIPSLVTQIRLPSDIEEARRVFDSARETFLTTAAKSPAGTNRVVGMRSRIMNSWERCKSVQVRPDLMRAPLSFTNDSVLAQAKSANAPLLSAATDVLSYLAATLADTGYGVLLTDPTGCVLECIGPPDVRRRLDRFGLVPGGDLSEQAAGTNAIGTAILDDRPLQLMAGEHFVEGGQELTCTAAPVHDPKTGAVAGVLDFSADYRLVRSQLLTAAVQYALEIEERLATATP